MKKLAYFLFPIIVIIVAYTFFRTGSDKEYIQLIIKPHYYPQIYQSVQDHQNRLVENRFHNL